MALSIALELYTVRDETARDFPGTLRRVAEIGYTAVEFAGYGGLPADEMAVLLQELGLKAPSSHVSIDAMARDPDREIDYCRTIGCAYLVVPGVPHELQVVDRLAGRLDELGELCRAAGLQLGYHNHDWEFRPNGDMLFIERLLTVTDPDLVHLELDVYWAAFAGKDPAEFLRQHAGRIPLLHLKDMTPERTFAEVGDGVLGLSSLVKTGPDQGVRWGVVENDAPTMPSLESARRSWQNLQTMQAGE
jgi:sugar phosphate isomerase/epimerase